MALSSLSKLAVAWLIMWGLSYIIVAIIAPNIATDTPAVFYVWLGCLILFGLLLRYLAHDKIGYTIVKLCFFALGTLMVGGGVASWTCVARWNVPYMAPDLAQVSMAFADLISAVFMFVLVLED